MCSALMQRHAELQGTGFFFFVCVLVGCIPPPSVLDCVYTQACLAMDHSKEEPPCSGMEGNNRA